MLTRRVLASRKFPSVIIRPKSNRFSLEFHGEQEPNLASRITLIRDTDRLGVSRVSGRLALYGAGHPQRSVASDVLAEEFARSGAGRLT